MDKVILGTEKFCPVHYESWRKGYIRGFNLSNGNKNVWIYCDEPNITYEYKTIQYNYRNKNLYIDGVNLRKMARCRFCSRNTLFYHNARVNPTLEEVRDWIHYKGFGQIC